MKLNALFSDGMVFQAGKSIRIFGTGGGTVKVEFLGRTAEQLVWAADWCVELPAADYGGPYEMRVSLDGREKVIRDIYIGDVYLLAGQSNMQFKLYESSYPLEKTRSHSKVRLFSTERMESGEPFYPEDGWVACTAENAGKWPCIGYLLGDELAEKTDHAIGFITCYQGAAAIQAYIPESVFENENLVIPEDKRYDMQYPWNAGTSQLYHYGFKPLVPYSMGAVIWYQGESNASEEESAIYYELLGSLIETWRNDLKDEELRFIVVQIADYTPRLGSAWSRIQQAQLKAGETIRRVDTVVCRDVCDTENIHPADKTELCHRIAAIL